MRSAIGIAAALLLIAPYPAGASSCVRPVVQQIRFEKGATCWTYSGKATHFEGRFSAGQNVTVRMSGVLLEYNEKKKTIETRWSARVPSVTGPQEFSAEGDFDDERGVLEVTVPAGGTYRFGFYPCAMWHNPGQVEICASAAAKAPSK